jgi:hypothetical protein
MGNRLRSSIFAVAAVFAISLPMLGQTAQGQAAATAPDLSGLWIRQIYNARTALYFTKEEPPMLPWAAERYKEIRKGRKGMNDPRPDQGRDDLDPAQYPYCMPYGYPRAYTNTDAFEIVQSPGLVYILFEGGEVQRIYTDGRKFPKGPPLTFMGQSIGRWEGDTLVLETKEMNDLTWIDGIGHQHSDALRVEQRIRRVDHDTIEMNFLFDDPKTYSKPWGGKKMFKSMPSTDYVFNYFLCEDPAREHFLRDVPGKKEGR